MEKLGLRRDIDLALHLPLRYEDETRVSAIADAPDGEPVQVEGIVRECRIELRGRRQLLVRIEDDSDDLLLRFLNFYPSHQKTLAVGARVRVRGEAHAGFFGREMVHPQFKAVDENSPLATALTPVYPTSAQLPQAYLRKAVAAALRRAALDEVLPPGTVPTGLPSLRDALHSLHHPPAGAAMSALEDRSRPAWQRLKFEELLAQQLSQLASQRERARLRAPLLRAEAGGLHERLLAALPFQLTAAQRRVAEEIAGDLMRPPEAGAAGDVIKGAPGLQHGHIVNDRGAVEARRPDPDKLQTVGTGTRNGERRRRIRLPDILGEFGVGPRLDQHVIKPNLHTVDVCLFPADGLEGNHISSGRDDDGLRNGRSPLLNICSLRSA